MEHARRAMQIAREHGAEDLEVFALSLLGRAEVSAGRRDAGLALLEEAMAAASAGRVRNVHTLGEAYCNLITATTNAGDWARAAEWCEHVDGFAREHDVFPLLGACGTAHADVLVATGNWPEAEHALKSALAAHARHTPSNGAPTIAALAELRVRQGRLPEAEQLLAGREVHPSSLRALAQLRIAEGRPQVAAALLERGLASTGDEAMRVTSLLAPLVDAHLACGDIARAEAAATTLPASRALAAFGRLAMPLDCLRRAHRARAGGARADRARDVERPHRADARHQREDRGPPRQPHPLQARRAQPHASRRTRGAHRLGIGTE